MLVLTQSQRMVINVEYVDCMFIKKRNNKEAGKIRFILRYGIRSRESCYFIL